MRWLVYATVWSGGRKKDQLTFGEVAYLHPGPCARCVGRAVQENSPDTA